MTATFAKGWRIGALQPHLEDIGRRKLLSPDDGDLPDAASVAPPGGVATVINSNTSIACILTGGDPILVDQSGTLVSNGAIATTDIHRSCLRS